MAKTNKKLKLYDKYGVYHHNSKSNDLIATTKSKKHQKIEVQLKILHMLIKSHLDSNDESYKCFMSNKYIADSINVIMEKSYGRSILPCEVKTYLNRLCNADLISIDYNPLQACRGQNSYYSPNLANGFVIAKNRKINHDIARWREITINIDYIMELYSVVDFSDQLYANLEMRSIIKKVIKRRAFTSLFKIKQRKEEIKRIIAEKQLNTKSITAPFFHFVKTVSTQYYNINSYAFAGVKIENVSDNGEVFYVEDFDEKQSLLLDKIYRNL